MWHILWLVNIGANVPGGCFSVSCLNDSIIRTKYEIPSIFRPGNDASSFGRRNSILQQRCDIFVLLSFERARGNKRQSINFYSWRARKARRDSITRRSNVCQFAALNHK